VQAADSFLRVAEQLLSAWQHSLTDQLVGQADSVLATFWSFDVATSEAGWPNAFNMFETVKNVTIMTVQIFIVPSF